MPRVEAHLHIGRFLRGQDDCISVRPTNFRVHYSGTLALSDVTFAVQPAGLRKFRTTGQKNVHAFVRGTVVAEYGNQVDAKLKGGYMREAYYNPNLVDQFVDRQTGKPLTKARAAYMVGNKVYYIPSEA